MVTQAERILAFVGEHWEAKASIEILDDPEVKTFEQAVERLKDQRKAIDRYLRELPPQKLHTVAKQAMAEADLARPFHAYGTEAEFEHWGRCPCLTVAEAAALSLGKNPRIVSEDSVRPFYGISIFADDFANRLDLLERAVVFGELPNLFSPLQFLTWAHEHKIAVPHDFIGCAFARGEPIRYWHDLCLDLVRDLEAVSAERDTALTALDNERASQLQRTFEDWQQASETLVNFRNTHEAEMSVIREALASAKQEMLQLSASLMAHPPLSDEEALKPTERKTLLIMATAMAVDCYAFDPRDNKSSAPKEIENAAQLVGLKLTDDTARKYLKEGSKLKGFSTDNARRRKPNSVKQKPKSV